MDRTASYFIIITRSEGDYVASAPAFPHISARARGARIAYARLKALLKAQLLVHLTDGRPTPRDPVVQTRTLRVDLWYLREQEELR